MSTKAAEAAVPLIRNDDAESQRVFVAMRDKGVMAAAARGDMATADRWLGFFPPGAGGDGGRPWNSVRCARPDRA